MTKELSIVRLGEDLSRAYNNFLPFCVAEYYMYIVKIPKGYARYLKPWLRFKEKVFYYFNPGNKDSFSYIVIKDFNYHDFDYDFILYLNDYNLNYSWLMDDEIESLFNDPINYNEDVGYIKIIY